MSLDVWGVKKSMKNFLLPKTCLGSKWSKTQRNMSASSLVYKWEIMFQNLDLHDLADLSVGLASEILKISQFYSSCGGILFDFITNQCGLGLFPEHNIICKSI